MSMFGDGPKQQLYEAIRYNGPDWRDLTLAQFLVMVLDVVRAIVEYHQSDFFPESQP